jgi:CDP-glucose 4,6-dehydratase
MVQGDGGPHEANFLKLDCAKAKAKLNWKPKLHIKEAVEMVVAWYERVNLNSPVQEVLNSQIKKYQTL